jgi:Alpha/beta hydrolase domain
MPAQPLPTVEALWAAAQLRAVSIEGPGTALNALLPQHASAEQVEQEFRLTGLAARYRLPDLPAQAECLDTGHPYATRLLVRRPADPARFNGTVLVEWLNVSAGQDLDFVYAATRELIVRAGYAWVGVSAQRVGVERLVAWNPIRYAGLSVAAPLDDPDHTVPLDPAQVFTGAAGGDVLCWDIYSHVALLLRRNPQVLGLPAVGHVVAGGESQSAFRLSRYFNTLQPKLGLFDGFLLYDRGGPQALRTEVPAKVISMGSEFFAEYAGAPPPDSGNQRWWELAGASHVSLAEMAHYIDPQVRRDGVLPLNGQAASLTEVMSQGGGSAEQPLWSHVPNGDLMKAALHALRRWIGQGVAPPCAPRLQLSSPAAAPGNLLRDAQGRALGGVRYAAYEVPTAINVGVTPDAPKLAGYHLDFTREEMTRRYGSPARYLAQVKAVVEANVTQGFLLAEDAQRVLREASAVRFEG